MGYETIVYEKRDQIGYVTFNRPEALNAYNVRMMNELAEVWQEFGADPDVRVAIMTGSGRGFCTGLDVKESASGVRGVAETINFTPRRSGVFKPVICAVNGLCVGGGFHFILDSDITICSDQASFFDGHVSIGAVSHREIIGLSRRIGYNNALRIGLMGVQERLPAQRAYEMGLVAEVVPQEELLGRAEELAERIRRNAPLAVAGTIKAMWRSLNLGVEDAVVLSAEIADRNRLTEDYREGPRAFTEKRQPQWKGR